MPIARVIFEQSATEDYRYWRSKDPRVAQCIHDTIQHICKEPFAGGDALEPFCNCDEGFWSTPISSEHALIYGINGDELTIVRCRNWNAI